MAGVTPRGPANHHHAVQQMTDTDDAGFTVGGPAILDADHGAREHLVCIREIQTAH